MMYQEETETRRKTQLRVSPGGCSYCEQFQGIGVAQGTTEALWNPGHQTVEEFPFLRRKGGEEAKCL